MTTLRNFQNTIEEIRELAKQKAPAAAASDKDLKKEKGKANENLHGCAAPSHSGARDPLEFEEKILVITLSQHEYSPDS